MMRDPHVKCVRYKLKTISNVSYSDSTPPIYKETDVFCLHLLNGLLAIELKDHYPTIESARMDIEVYLRSWELETALQSGRREIQFEYIDSDIIDRDPPPPGSAEIFIETGSAHVQMSGNLTVHVIRSNYPEPPGNFRATSDVDTLWHRYEEYLNGHEPLLAMGYFCLSYLETIGGGGITRAERRQKIKDIYQIDITVLDKLGDLVSEGGDKTTARKVKNLSNLKPLSGSEINWIESTIKIIIRRLGEHSPGVSLPIIDMTSLPRIITS